jgi:hypothetical protein
MHRSTLRLVAITLVTLGLLTLGVASAAAQDGLTVEVTFDQTTIDPRTGEATLSGTITCSEPASVDVNGALQQVIGRIATARSFFVFSPVECPGPEGTSFTVTLTADQGRFAPGPARITAEVFGCVFVPEVGCTELFFEELDRTIRLKPAA